MYTYNIHITMLKGLVQTDPAKHYICYFHDTPLSNGSNLPASYRL